VNRMRMDAIDSNVISQYESSGQLPGGNTSTTVSSLTTPAPTTKDADSAPKQTTVVKLTEDEEKLVEKYRKMEKMGLAQQSIMNKMVQDGVSKDLINKMYGNTNTGKKPEAEKKTRIATKSGSKKSH